MQIAYFDCFSGISGDMALGALLDAGAELDVVQAAIASMELGEVKISVANTAKRGFRGKLLTIVHPPEQSHRFLKDILMLLRRARVSSGAKDLAMRLFERIARAEAKVHGTTIDRVQFHEVGAIDSIVDILGVAVAWDMLKIERAYSSPIPTGTGQVRIAHGLVSIPAPATAELLVGVPIAPTQIPMEMTTPTGAAIVTELVSEYGPMPPMQVGRIGYGAGRKDMPDRPNLLRILLGNALEQKPQHDDSILVMETNLDDVTGEQIGFAIDQLWKAGALDVFTTPIQMKKNRPAILLSVIARPSDRSTIESILFKQTGTLGIRYRSQSRTILPRSNVIVQTQWGSVAGKVSRLPTGEDYFSAEYDDCGRIASRFGLQLLDVFGQVEKCFRDGSKTIGSATIVNAADAPFLDGDSELMDHTAAIDNVNADFRQAAVEDELDAVASNRVAMETTSSSESGAILPLANDVARVPLIPLLEHPELCSEEVQESYYRWEGSPWDEPPNPPA